MAITSVQRRKEGRTSSRTARGRRYVETYVVKGEAGDNEDLVYAAVGVPTVGLVYSEDVEASCTDVSVIARTGTHEVWDVTATYESNRRERTTYDWTITPIREVIQTDAADNAIINSLGDPYSPALERDIYAPTVKITRSEYSVNQLGGTFNPFTLFDYVGTVNSSVLDIDGYLADAGEALMKDIQVSDELIVGNGSYQEVTYTIMFRLNNSAWDSLYPVASPNNAWFSIVLDAGMRHLDTAGATVVQARSGDGTPAKQPILLDGAGKALPNGDPPVYQAFRIYPEANFAALNL